MGLGVDTNARPMFPAIPTKFPGRLHESVVSGRGGRVVWPHWEATKCSGVQRGASPSTGAMPETGRPATLAKVPRAGVGKTGSHFQPLPAKNWAFRP